MSILDPPLIDDLGQPIDVRSDDAIEAHQPGAPEPYATAQLAPLGWDHGRADKSRMVGWTIHRRGSSQIIDSHAFSINPQSITRTDSPRNQMFATQDGFYVDDFGPGPTNIQISQLVAHGRRYAAVGGQLSRATMREDVLRFKDVIYERATANPGQYDVYWHDNHLWTILNSKSPERVYFPPQSLQIMRSVQLHNVWQLQLTMVTLDPPSSGRNTGTIPGQPRIRVHVVRRGETLLKLAAKLAHAGGNRHPSHKRILQIQQQIIALTKKYGADDITKARTVPIYSASNPSQWLNLVAVSRLHLAAGEKIILPG